MNEPWTKERFEDYWYGQCRGTGLLSVAVPCNCGECHGWRMKVTHWPEPRWTLGGGISIPIDAPPLGDGESITGYDNVYRVRSERTVRHGDIRRVPLGFDWPLNKVWSGYLSPYDFPSCEVCDGTGHSPEARAIVETFYPHQIGGPNADRLAWCDKIGQAEVDNLVAHGRLRVWRDSRWESVPRTAEEINRANRRPRLFGESHDAVNHMILAEFRCERLGIAIECPACNGHGDVATDEERAEAEAWKSSDPPAGEGWQLWETSSEGYPVSPVFVSAEELASWCETGATIFADERLGETGSLLVASGYYQGYLTVGLSKEGG